MKQRTIALAWLRHHRRHLALALKLARHSDSQAFEVLHLRDAEHHRRRWWNTRALLRVMPTQQG
jgi:hypothetical protein